MELEREKQCKFWTLILVEFRLVKVHLTQSISSRMVRWQREELDKHIIQPVSHRLSTIVLQASYPLQSASYFFKLCQFWQQCPQFARVQVIWTSRSGIHAPSRAKPEPSQAHYYGGKGPQGSRWPTRCQTSPPAAKMMNFKDHIGISGNLE